MIELLTDNHLDKILDLFDGIKNNIKIISPFVQVSMVERLCRAVSKGVTCTFITRFYVEDMINKASSIDALEMMVNNGIEVYALKRLHTKLYLFDNDNAILGSANFTNGGFKSNIELSLLLTEENVINELHNYFDEIIMLLKQMNESIVTKEMIADSREDYKEIFKSKKSGAAQSFKMYGALLSKQHRILSNNNFDYNDIKEELDLCKNEEDFICKLFRSMEQTKQIYYPYNIWLKFTGAANDRINPNDIFPMVSILKNGKKVFVCNYPFKCGSVKDNDEVYFAGLTTLTTDKRKNQPVIVGRGHLEGFNENNYADAVILQQYEWMKDYPWYCVIKDYEIINAPMQYGIPLDNVLDSLGSDTYLSSFGRNEDIASVTKKHYQKTHIRLSGNAKEFIDKRLDELFRKYGTI